MNKIILVGRLCGDPELRFVGENNVPVTKFTLAVNRNYKNKLNWGLIYLSFFMLVLYYKPHQEKYRNSWKYRSNNRGNSFINTKFIN